MSITTRQSLTARLALFTTLVGGTLAIGAAPAQAKSYVVFEAGRAKHTAGMIECKQFVMERDGADIQSFSVQPRIEKYVRTAEVKYRDKNGKVKTKKVEKWKAVGGTTNPAHENRQYGGRNQNAVVATGTFQNPRGAWTYRRHTEGHGRYRCLGFISAAAIISGGTLHKIGPARMEGPQINTTHR